jgi:hypothetical protein
MLHLGLILHTARAAERRPELTEFLLLALEDGFRLHRLSDPDSTPPDSFVQSQSVLQQALSGGES